MSRHPADVGDLLDIPKKEPVDQQTLLIHD